MSPRAITASTTLPLLWHGPVRDPSGYADECRTHLLALRRAGLRVPLRETRFSSKEAGIGGEHLRVVEEFERLAAPPAEHVSLYHMVPQGGQPFGDDGPTVARTMFETDRIPSGWLRRLFDVDEIWVPCGFNVDTFERGGVPRRKLRVLPGTIDFDLFAPGAAEPLADPGRSDRFTFLANFDFTDRKGWDVLLDAWADAFSPDDGVRLLLKCISLHGMSDEGIRARIDDHLGGRPTAPIDVTTSVLSVGEIPRLYACADAYVLPSRGEGWGRPYMEAMALGLPTIGSRWSGNLEFMHDGNSWLVDGDVVPVPRTAQGHSNLYDGHSWFEPRRESLTAALRDVHSGRHERAVGARDELIERFGPAAIAGTVTELVDSALERWRGRSARRPLCAWRGQWGSSHSLAVVNDALVAALESENDEVVRRAPESPPVLSDLAGITSSWPPVFEQLSAGPLVLYQPWEFGQIPKRWADEIRRGVDEVWTPSEHSRQAYLASGIAPELVHVVPNGVNLQLFVPEGPRLPLPTAKRTVFLFVGGTVYRKGIDVLLTAFARAFTRADDVALVVKGVAGQSFYRGQTADGQLATFLSLPDAPELVVLDDQLPTDAVASLYRAADVLVQPYRGEGFCLPVLEALACGVPAIVTAGGPTDDVTSPDCAWRIPAVRAPLPDSELDLVDDGWLLEPDVDALVEALLEAADPVARAARAAHARAHAERWSWDKAAAAVRIRLEALRGVTPIRRVSPAHVPDRRATLFAAHVDWTLPATWEPVVAAYARAFVPTSATTLVLPTDDEERSAALVTASLERAALDPATLADVVLADASSLPAAALELASDAFIHAAGARPTRARVVLPPEPTALKEATTWA